MFVESNKLNDFKAYFHAQLNDVCEAREIDNLYYWVAEHYFGLNRIEVNRGDKRLSESEMLSLRGVVKRLALNEPIQYILGETEFYNCNILVNSSVLIPRPETEELVDLVIHKVNPQSKILDIGTGSGCIPIALKKHMPKASMSAIDIDPNAIQLAKKSAELNHVEIDFYQLDILIDQLNDFKDLDVIISNPPYVLELDKAEMGMNVLEFEPHLALFVPDHKPLMFYQRIALLATQKLVKGGLLFFEIHEDFGVEMTEMLNELGFIDILIQKDMQNKDRMMIAKLP